MCLVSLRSTYINQIQISISISQEIKRFHLNDYFWGEIIVTFDNFFQNIEAYPHKFWFPAEKEGYAGVALFSKEKPIHVQV